MSATDDPSPGLERELGRRRIAAGEARTAVLRRTYDAPIEDVWNACTDPERLNRWFLVVSGDLRPGGRFSLAGNAGGEILTCEPPRLLELTWIYGDRPVDEVRVRLAPHPGGGTALEIEHATVGTEVEWEGRMVDVITGLGSGWELPLSWALPKYLRGELPDAPAAEWYAPTAEHMALAERSAEAWAALVAAGRDGAGS
jgi:uncharacterized protein YndB with AHSA1/START domain